MTFRPGDEWNGNAGGRPRRLDVELRRLTEAAQHARMIVEQQALVVALLHDEPGQRADADRNFGAGIRELREIERRVAELTWLAEEVERLKPRKWTRLEEKQDLECEAAGNRAAAELDRLMKGLER